MTDVILDASGDRGGRRAHLARRPRSDWCQASDRASHQISHPTSYLASYRASYRASYLAELAGVHSRDERRPLVRRELQRRAVRVLRIPDAHVLCAERHLHAVDTTRGTEGALPERRRWPAIALHDPLLLFAGPPCAARQETGSPARLCPFAGHVPEPISVFDNGAFWAVNHVVERPEIMGRRMTRGIATTMAQIGSGRPGSAEAFIAARPGTCWKVFGRDDTGDSSVNGEGQEKGDGRGPAAGGGRTRDGHRPGALRGRDARPRGRGSAGLAGWPPRTGQRVVRAVASAARRAVHARLPGHSDPGDARWRGLRTQGVLGLCGDQHRGGRAFGVERRRGGPADRGGSGDRRHAAGTARPATVTELP